MTVTAVLVDATPFRLRYLFTQDGVLNSPPQSPDWSFEIPNDVPGASPDLNADSGGRKSPLGQIIDAARNGYPPNASSGTPVHPAGAMTQAQARALMNSDDAAGALLTNQRVGRAVCEITPRTGPLVNWCCDVNVDGEGDPIIRVMATPDVGVGTAYLDIHFRHTYDL